MILPMPLRILVGLGLLGGFIYLSKNKNLLSGGESFLSEFNNDFEEQWYQHYSPITATA